MLYIIVARLVVPTISVLITFACDALLWFVLAVGLTLAGNEILLKKKSSFLKELRKEKNLTQEQLAERFNVSGRTVSRRETENNMLAIAVVALLLLCTGIFFFAFRSEAILSRYEYIYLLQNITSPDGQNRVELLILGKEAEDGAFPVENPVNERYDICVRLWFKPQEQSNGSIMWHDDNTKIIYFQKDCTNLEVEWVNNNTVMVDGKEIDI